MAKLTGLMLCAFLFNVSGALCGTLYYDRQTGEILKVTADALPVSDPATDIATAAIPYPTDVSNMRWNGSRLIPIQSQEVSAREIRSWRRDLWLLKAVRSIAQDDATTSELRAIDRDLEMMRRRILQVVGH